MQRQHLTSTINSKLIHESEELYQTKNSMVLIFPMENVFRTIDG